MPTPAQNIILFGQPRPAVLMDFQSGRYQLGTQSFASLLAMTGATFTRASAGNALNSGGTIIAFGSGVPRITDLGLLIEEARTNLFLNSFAPVNQTITLVATGNYTLSVWGTGSVAVAAGTATITGAGSASSGAPKTINCTGTGTVTLTVTGSPTAVNFEAGAFGTSPITTTGSTATRAADNLSITNGALSSSNVTIWGKVYFPLIPSATLQIVQQGSNKPALRIAASHALDPWIPSVGDASGPGGIGVGYTKFATSYTIGRIIGAVSGVLGSATAVSWTQGSGTTLYIGVDSSGSLQWLNGYLTALALAPATLSDGQVQGLSQ